MELYVYRVRLAPVGRVRFEKFPGIHIEGALTGAVRAISCVCRDDAAIARCPAQRRCAFNLLVRPRADLFPELPKRYRPPPAPLVLRPRFPAGTYTRGDELELMMVLVGRAHEHLRWVLAGLAKAGRRGVGPERNAGPLGGCFKVSGIEAIGPGGAPTRCDGTDAAGVSTSPWRFPDDFQAPAPAWCTAGSFTVEFRSPTLVPRKPASRGSLEFSDLITTLGKRVSVLSMAYGDRHLIDYQEHCALKAAADGVRVAARGCQWDQWTRRSEKQQRSFTLGGWSGWVRYQGDVTPFVPLLRLGGLLHVGDHTIRGFGEIALREGL